jgi:uronate dehydrogenase
VFEGARRAKAKRVIHASSNRPSATTRDAFIGSTRNRDTCWRQGVRRSAGQHVLGKSASSTRRCASARAAPDRWTGAACRLAQLPDLLQLIVRCLEAQRGFAVVYGQSDNDRALWDNAKVSHIGFRPQDNAETFAAKLLKNAKPENPKDPSVKYIGGVFCTKKPPMWQG